MPHVHAPAHGVPDHDWGSTSVALQPKPEQREALELLGHPTQGWVRLTVAQWDVVERVVRALRAASASVGASEGSKGVPVTPELVQDDLRGLSA